MEVTPAPCPHYEEQDRTSYPYTTKKVYCIKGQHHPGSCVFGRSRWRYLQQLRLATGSDAGA